ncbi:hypothetical protein GJ496_002509 [Pomphorhynchus laevis]|nr:hypothetical protein GJ496_002509 [Pomphorhynchus laevis]
MVQCSRDTCDVRIRVDHSEVADLKSLVNLHVRGDDLRTLAKWPRLPRIRQSEFIASILLVEYNLLQTITFKNFINRIISNLG